MRLPDYLPGQDAPLVDAMPWLEDELFWPAFLFAVGHAGSAPEAFGVDPADLEAFLDDFERSDLWPVFTVAIGRGVLHLIVRNFPGDPGLDWLVDAEIGAAARRLAAEDGGDSPGPGLPWGLLPTDPVNLLLALPAFGKGESGGGDPGPVAAALRAVGATASVDELAAELFYGR
ncbi:hypothetical protein AB0J72_51020 [Dactylosporangium sp. NPDC049742]|uniref:hypothetical protein n=1 Tax=Dactylosporangium sp. NPDC049742 TaxID=3154737 RepID=UPI003440910E